MPEELLDNPSNPVNQQPSPMQQPPFQGVNPVESQSYKKNIEPPQSLVDDYDTIMHQPYQPADIQPLVVSPQASKMDQTGIHDKSKNKKKIFFGALISLAILLASSSSSFALVSWYQNPQKVITDSLINMLTTRASVYTGSVKFTSDDIKISVDLTAKQENLTAGSLAAKVTVNISGKDYDVNSDALMDSKGDLYIRLQNLGDIVNVAETSLGIIPNSTNFLTSVDKLVKEIDGTWIKINNDDLKQYSSDTSTAKTCTSDALKKINSDKATYLELFDLYQKRQFIVMDKSLGQKGDSLGYSLKVDTTALKSFQEGLVKTKIYKSIHDCDSNIVANTTDIDKVATSPATTDKIELWTNIWSHQITKIVASSTDNNRTSFEATLMPQYNQKVTITAPSTSITVSQLQTYVQDVAQAFQSSMSAQ